MLYPIIQSLIIILIYILLIYIYLYDIFSAKSLIFPYAIHPYDIINEKPDTWLNILKYFWYSTYILCIVFLLSNVYKKYNTHKNSIRQNNKNKFFNDITNNIDKKLQKQIENENTNIINNISMQNELQLILGFTQLGKIIHLGEKALNQNILITGSIGTGKTSSAMYNLTEQLIKYSCNNNSKKLGILILDVKGNYHNFVKKVCNENNRTEDLYTISLDGNIKYNPLDKKDLKASVLANRLKQILLLFSPNNSESFWIDKAEQVIQEVIKYIRLYNNRYVTFTEIHKVINDYRYYYSKKKIIKEKLLANKYTPEEIYDINTSLDFLEKEFFKLDDRTLGILRAEITRITNIFISDYSVQKTFCSKETEITFKGFKDLITNGKIVVLNINIAEYGELSKIIASYLKLDFQTEILKQLSQNNNIRQNVFISDEYQEYVTKNDANFYSQSREAKCINIIATQSYTSLKNALKDEAATDVIIQSLVNKIWFRNDDVYTIEKAQSIIGKEEKEKTSKTLSESSNESNYNYLLKKFISNNSNLSESINNYTQFDYVYDTSEFSQKLKTFETITFLSNSANSLKVEKVKMIPHFLKKQFLKNEC